MKDSPKALGRWNQGGFPALESKKGKIFYLFIYCFETESHSVTQVGLELWATLLLQNLNSGITSISNYL